LFLTIFLLTAIGLVLGIVIFIVNRLVPVKVKGIEKTEELTSYLPGMNCGACGQPGCFAFAQACTTNPDLISQGKCALVMQDSEKCDALAKSLGLTLDAAEMSKKAVIHCSGNPEVIFDYSGVKTCKGAAQLHKGNKKCPYACLGLGDCAEVCPQNAITVRPDNNIAVIDPVTCIGCGLCLDECPQNLIELVPAGIKIALLCNYASLKDIPGREKCDFGCMHCRKCIKACEVEAVTWNKDKALPEFDIAKCTLCGKCIEICPDKTIAFFKEVKTVSRELALVQESQSS